jgi:hypothetical protein
MTSSHFLFIPLVLIAGAILGFFFGTRVARDAYNRELAREKEREKVRREREERRKRKAAEKAADSDDDSDDDAA